jgi:deoxyribonuclease V
MQSTFSTIEEFPFVNYPRYNYRMLIRKLHEWDVSIPRAKKIQQELACRIQQSGEVQVPRLIAGLDVSVDKFKDATAAVVILDYPALRVIETITLRGRVDFPYVPGLLSFREIPITLEICGKIKNVPDLVMVDGQGYAHPRRIGLASHLGLVLDRSTIGCAKSHLCGEYEEPGIEKGDFSLMVAEKEEVIGAALRTKDSVNPLFISVGHKISLSSAIYWVLQCCRGYRLPEPTRLAHLASRGCKI